MRGRHCWPQQVTEFLPAQQLIRRSLVRCGSERNGVKTSIWGTLLCRLKGDLENSPSITTKPFAGELEVQASTRVAAQKQVAINKCKGMYRYILYSIRRHRCFFSSYIFSMLIPMVAATAQNCPKFAQCQNVCIITNTALLSSKQLSTAPSKCNKTPPCIHSD